MTFYAIVKQRLTEAKDRVEALRRQLTEAEAEATAWEVLLPIEGRRDTLGVGTSDLREVVGPPAEARRVEAVTVYKERSRRDVGSGLTELQTAILIAVDGDTQGVASQAIQDTVGQLLPIYRGKGRLIGQGLASLTRRHLLKKVRGTRGDTIYTKVG